MKKTRRNIAIVIFLAAFIFSAPFLFSGTLTVPNRFYPGDPRTPQSFNENYTAIENSVNNVETPQIANNAVTSAKILDGTIAQGDMSCTGYWDTLTFCDGNEQNADTQHRHDAAYVTITSATFTASFVDEALDELAGYTGYYAGATGTTTAAIRYVGFATGTGSITVATDTNVTGINVQLSGFIAVGANSGFSCVVAIPISINGTDLSTVGSHIYRYTLSLGVSAASIESYSSSVIIYDTGNGWDNTRSNVIDVGTPYALAGSACTASATSDHMIVVNLIK